jgi:hypothetical protein
VEGRRAWKRIRARGWCGIKEEGRRRLGAVSGSGSGTGATWLRSTVVGGWPEVGDVGGIR